MKTKTPIHLHEPGFCCTVSVALTNGIVLYFSCIYNLCQRRPRRVVSEPPVMVAPHESYPLNVGTAAHLHPTPLMPFTGCLQGETRNFTVAMGGLTSTRALMRKSGLRPALVYIKGGKWVNHA